MMSMQVDRINQRRIAWGPRYANPNSEEYRSLEDEANYAVSRRHYSLLRNYKKAADVGNVMIYF